MNAAQDQTATRSPELELDELLSETPADAARRAESRFSIGDPLALYGAGHLGRQVLALLRSMGVEPVAFVDDTPAKQGTSIDGLQVLAPRNLAERFGRRVVLAVTVYNPGASYLRIKQQLQAQSDTRVISFLELAWKYHKVFMPYYQFELPQNVLEKARYIRRAFRVFADEESSRQFVAHVRFRLHLDFGALPSSNCGDYFPAGVVPELGADTTFVDCGAFDGDTLRRFIARQHGRFREIYAFEPDAENFRRLTEYASRLGAEATDRIHLFRAAVGARRARLRFDSSGGMASALSDAGAEEVDVIPVQEVVSAREAGALFLKFDVEGGEAAALEGAAGLINARSIVAVCVYHRPDDLWELPLKLRALTPKHKLFLRTQGEDGMDVVCYAVPDRWDKCA